jgi:hypothetical protein
VAAPESPSQRPGLFRILESDGSRKVIQQTHTVRGVKKEIPKEVRGGDFETAENLWNIQLFPKSQLASGDYLDTHHSAPH